MRTKLLLLLLLCCGFFVSAQNAEETINYGDITMEDGSTQSGVIMFPSATLPWAKQRKIFFLAADSIDTSMKYKKNDMEKYEPGDITGFTIDDRTWGVIEYVNMKGASQGSDLNTVNRLATMTKNLGTSTYFAESYHQGKVSLYKFFNSPPGFSITGSDEESAELKALAENAKRNYDIIIIKEGENGKSFNDMNVKKYFGDCKEVVKKFENKEYTKKPNKGLKAMVANAMIYGDALAAAAMEMINDYEALCAK